MKDTKQKILTAARLLYNDVGYSQVTIRMIASELNMSSGHLNYHFRKREDILEALYFEMVEIFDKRVRLLQNQKMSLTIMQSSVRDSMMRMMEYQFFWTDLYHLLQSNKKINAHFKKVKSHRINGYETLFDVFIEDKTLKKPSFRDEHLHLIDRMITYSNTWLYGSKLYENKKRSAKIIAESSYQLLSMLYPYLTKKGQGEFKNIFLSRMT